MRVEFKRRKAEPHIPFIALADIAWQIIIFFLIASTFAISNALNVDLPNSVPQAQAQPGKSITVQATGTGISIDGKPVEIESLEPTIARLLEGKKSEEERAVLVLGRDDLTFQRDVEIMYAVQKAGGILVISDDVPPTGSSDAAGSPPEGDQP